MSRDPGQGPEDLQRAVARYVDGEMSPAEARKFASRIASDAGGAEFSLGEMLREAQELRALFAPGRAEPTPSPDAGFKSRVIAEITGMPSHGELEKTWRKNWEQECLLAERRRLALWGQAIAAAALILFALGAMVYTGLLGPADSGRLEASPAEIESQMRLLDEEISRRVEPAGAKGRDR